MARKAMTKSNRPARRRVVFEFVSSPGRNVAVAGTFNGWQPEKPLVDKNGDGVYIGILLLEPGTYEYKFVIDGEWRLDDNNPNFAPNDFGSLNSVVVVDEI